MNLPYLYGVIIGDVGKDTIMRGLCVENRALSTMQRAELEPYLIRISQRVRVVRARPSSSIIVAN